MLTVMVTALFPLFVNFRYMSKARLVRFAGGSVTSCPKC